MPFFTVEIQNTSGPSAETLRWMQGFSREAGCEAFLRQKYLLFLNFSVSINDK